MEEKLITSELLEAHLACSTKCYLRSIGEHPKADAYPGWLRARNDAYKREGIERLLRPLRDPSFPQRTNSDLKSASWHVEINQMVRAHSLETRIHAIQHFRSDSDTKSWQAVPLRFSCANKLTRIDRVLAGFDALVLSEHLGTEVHTAKIIHGDNWSTQKVNTSVLSHTLTRNIAKIAELLRRDSPPPLTLNRHCPECEFRDRCWNKAVEADDVSLLVGLTEKEKMHLNGRGIFTVGQVSYTFRPRRRRKRLSAIPERYHHSLRARAIRERKIHLIGNPDFRIKGTPVFFDVEGIPDRDFYYLIGARVEDTKLATHLSLWADTTQGEEQIWHDFLTLLGKLSNPVLVHYGSFETTFLRKMQRRYGGLADGSAAATAISSSMNLLSTIYGKVYFPSYSNGLKENARFLGFEWEDVRASGLQSIVWRTHWEERRDPILREQLITYNRNDCEALSLVARSLERLLNSRTGAGDASENQQEAVHAELLKEAGRSKWGAFKSPIPDLERVNFAARWNYQRDRVFVRSGLFRKRTARRPPKPSRARMRPHRVVVLNAPNLCPLCGKRCRKKRRMVSRTVQDLVFGKDSVRRRIVQYVVQIYACRSCGHEYCWRELLLHGRDWGWNVVAYFVYHIIGLYLPQLTVRHNLNRLFGFNLARSTLNNMKTKAADTYSITRMKILDRIVNGKLIHADETTASIRGQLAYVWVLTNLTDVVYLLAPNREGHMVRDLLKTFNGILVSDFYAVYDSLACPQQKCLIHLMRDLNDEILKRPFDEEMKTIATRFASLLRKIVDTIDRRGLKAFFLRKHLKEVEHFYAFLKAQEFSSEPSEKCKQRFEKNRDKLFTFLRHDGIPWNNNNAEHAVKAFARLRDVVGGLSTEKGVEEYLTLLSVSETCRYQGVDFLDFLRSGETDLEAFAQGPRRYRRDGHVTA